MEPLISHEMLGKRTARVESVLVRISGYRKGHAVSFSSSIGALMAERSQPRRLGREPKDRSKSVIARDH